MDLSNASDIDLKEELAKREKLAKEKAKPKPLSDPNYTDLFQCCEQYINYLHHGNHTTNGIYDLKQWIFESAMETIYGPDIWMWINLQK